MRYDTPDGGGETRRQRNARFGASRFSKPVDIPDNYEHVWNWFWELSEFRKYSDGHAECICPKDILDWKLLFGNLITRRECAMIIAMDASFREALAVEIKNNTARAADAARLKAG